MNEPLAVIREYEDLRALMARRRRELGFSQLVLDEIAGLQNGYSAKLEASIKNFGDMSLGVVLAALGIVLIAIPAAGTDAKAVAVTNASIEKRKRVRRLLAAKGGRARAAALTPAERRAAARHAGKTRWRKWREAKAEKAARVRRGQRKKASTSTGRAPEIL
jgi:hypothetical protein